MKKGAIVVSMALLLGSAQANEIRIYESGVSSTPDTEDLVRIYEAQIIEKHEDRGLLVKVTTPCCDKRVRFLISDYPQRLDSNFCQRVDNGPEEGVKVYSCDTSEIPVNFIRGRNYSLEMIFTYPRNRGEPAVTRADRITLSY